MIKTITSILPDQLFDECNVYANSLKRSPSNVFFTNGTWGRQLIGESTPVLVHHLDPSTSLYKKILAAVTEKTGTNKTPTGILFYFWTSGSYIPWHTDTPRTGVTIYLNKDWNRDKGGLFMYEDTSGIRAVVPQPNLCIVNEEGVPHSTTPVLPNCGDRITIQMFFNGAVL